MPKIVDREKMRRQLGEAAIPYFRELGYRAANMRDLAKRLGISKSGMYHYFASKEEIFAYCGDLLVEQARQASQMPDTTPTEQCLHLAQELTQGFGDELYLILDYFKAQASETRETEMPKDNPFEAPLRAYLKTLIDIVGEDAAPTVLRLILGELMLRTLHNTPNQDWQDFARVLKTQIDPDTSC